MSSQFTACRLGLQAWRWVTCGQCTVAHARRWHDEPTLSVSPRQDRTRQIALNTKIRTLPAILSVLAIVLMLDASVFMLEPPTLMLACATFMLTGATLMLSRVTFLLTTLTLMLKAQCFMLVRQLFMLKSETLLLRPQHKGYSGALFMLAAQHKGLAGRLLMLGVQHRHCRRAHHGLRRRLTRRARRVLSAAGWDRRLRPAGAGVVGRGRVAAVRLGGFRCARALGGLVVWVLRRREGASVGGGCRTEVRPTGGVRRRGLLEALRAGFGRPAG